MTDHQLEAALDEIERGADAAVKAAAAALGEVKKAKSAAATGQLRALRQSLDNAVRLADAASTTARDLRDGWTFDELGHFASGAYTKEVLALAAEQGLDAFESDDRILSYPAIVALSPSDATVLIDKKRDKRARPSVLVRTLLSLQARPPRFKPDAFLEALATAYDLVIASKRGQPGGTVKLADVYNVLTVMPGAARDYSRQELARDLYLLDQSGVTTTKDGRELRLPASALTRGAGTLRTVTRAGQEKVYAGIAFEGGRR